MLNINNCTRLRHSLYKLVLSVAEPKDPSHISQLNQLTGESALVRLCSLMQANQTGAKILRDKPRFYPEQFDLTKKFTAGSLGEAFQQYCIRLKLDPRPTPTYLVEPSLVYVHQRYKQIHDFIHVLLEQDISIMGQLKVKWFEMEHFQLPSAAAAALLGSITLLRAEQLALFYRATPRLTRLARNSQLLLNVHFQSLFDKDLNQLRRELKLVQMK